MRVLVTRPEPGASITAAKLVALGHEPVLLPLSKIMPLAHTIPLRQFDAVLATSANAFCAFVEPVPETIRNLPLHVVGQQTAKAANAAGFTNCITVESDAEALAMALQDKLTARATVLYLCGKVRRPELEAKLADMGVEMVPVEVYDTISVSYTTEKIASTLGAPPIDAVLVYSWEAAHALNVLMATQIHTQLNESTRYLCISNRAASVLNTVASTQVLVAKTPDEAAIFDLLG